jgi:hypothetical protein
MNELNGGSPGTADCPGSDERISLLREYVSAAERYAWAVGQLERNLTNLSNLEHDQLHFQIEDVRGECKRLEVIMGRDPPGSASMSHVHDGRGVQRLDQF